MIFPRPAFDHPWSQLLREQKRRPEVDGHGAVPILRLRIQKGLRLGVRRVVDQDVYCPEVGQRLARRGAGPLDGGELGLDGQAFAALHLDRRARFRESLGVACDGDDVGARVGEDGTDLETESPWKPR